MAAPILLHWQILYMDLTIHANRPVRISLYQTPFFHGTKVSFKNILIGFENELFISQTADNKSVKLLLLCNVLKLGVFGEEIFIVM